MRMSKQTQLQMEEQLAKIREEEAIEAKVAYRAKRRKEYPSVGDQLDAIWKILNSSRAAAPYSANATARAVLEVKEKYPKPKDTTSDRSPLD